MFPSGDLTIHLGPMFSGKSTALIRSLGTYADLGVPCLYVNSDIDTRAKEQNEVVSNHSNAYSKVSTKVDVVSVKQLASVDIKGYKVIGIDEAQFFDDLLLVVDWVECDDVIVEVAGLDGSFERQPMGKVLDLVPYADTVNKLNAACKECLRQNRFKNAPFTGRRTTSKESVLVGGSECYSPLCRKCYLRLRH